MTYNKKYVGAYRDKKGRVRPITARRGTSGKTGLPLRSKTNSGKALTEPDPIDEVITIDGVSKTRQEWLLDEKSVEPGISRVESENHLADKIHDYAEDEKMDLDDVDIKFRTNTSNLAQVHGRSRLGGPPMDPWIIEDLELTLNPEIYRVYHRHIPDTMEKYSEYVIAHEFEHLKQWKDPDKGPGWIKRNKHQMEDLAQKKAMEKTGLTRSEVKELSTEIMRFSQENPDKIPPRYRAQQGHLIPEEYS